MKNLRIRGKLLLAFSAVSLASTVAFSTYTYVVQRSTILDGIDNKLTVAALSVPTLLPDGFHDRAVGKDSISPEEHQANMQLLTDYVSKVGVTFVYSFVKIDGNVFITSTNGTAEQYAKKETVPFYEQYTDPSPGVLRMFDTGEVLRETASDEYGEFRSVLFRVNSPSGKSSFVVGADMRTDEIKRTLAQTRLRCILIGALSFLATVLSSLLISSRITSPIVELAKQANDLSANNFLTDEKGTAALQRLAALGNDEVANLAKSFEKMVKTLAEYLINLKATTAAKERFESELSIAHDIQMSFLPKIFPPFPHRPEIDLYATLEPAKEVGGDLYDYCMIDEDHLFFYVGDVSDKGVPAALFMAVTMSLMKRTAQQAGISPDQILDLVNKDLAAENENFLFVTLFCGILNMRTGEVLYSNAGHNPPIIVRADGRAEWLKLPEGMVLAVMPENRYLTKSATLDKGDSLLLYTDGVTEAMSTERHLYSDEKLLELAATFKGAAADAIVKMVVKSVKEHAKGAAQSDDITVLTLTYKGV